MSAAQAKSLHIADALIDQSSHNDQRSRAEPEISWSFAPRLPPGEYPAFCRSSRTYWDKQFKRWSCAVQFEVLDDSLTQVLARLTWYLCLGAKEKPHAGRRGNYWAAWLRANGGSPKRGDRVSSRVFEGRHALVTVADTTKDHRQNPIAKEAAYSVIRNVKRWETGGPLR